MNAGIPLINRQLTRFSRIAWQPSSCSIGALSGGAVIEDVAKMSIALAAGDSRTFHPQLMSRISTMFSLAIGCQKLGQPVIQLWSLS
jgi:hypothetical protein